MTGPEPFSPPPPIDPAAIDEYFRKLHPRVHNPHVAYSSAKAKASWAGTSYDEVRPPDDVIFGRSTAKALQQVHPDHRLSFGAVLAMEDFSHMLLRALAEKAKALPRSAPFTDVYLATHYGDELAAGHPHLHEQLHSLEILAERRGPAGRSELCVFNAENSQGGWMSRVAVEGLSRYGVEEFDKMTPEEKEKTKEEFITAESHPVEVLERRLLLDGRDLITARHILTAVRLLLPGELAKHAISEGAKCMTKWSSSDTELPTVETAPELSRAVRLVFPVCRTGALLAAATGRCVGPGAAVYLAAVLEYMAAEVLELSGNCCRDNGSSIIQVWDLAKATHDDAELAQLLRENGASFLATPSFGLPLGGADERTAENDEGIRFIGCPPRDVDDACDACMMPERDFRPLAPITAASKLEDSAASEEMSFAGLGMPEFDPTPVATSTFTGPDDEAGASGSETGMRSDGGKGGKSGKHSAAFIAWGGGRQRRRVLRDNIFSIQRPAIDVIAARGGVVCHGYYDAAPIRDEIRRFLEIDIGNAVVNAKHRRAEGTPAIVSLEDVLGAASCRGAAPLGTGRLAAALPYGAPDPVSPIDWAACAWAEVSAGGDAEHPVQGIERGYVTEGVDEEPAGEGVDGSSADGLGPEFPSQQAWLRHISEQLVQSERRRQAQRPATPFPAFARIVMEVGQDFMSDLRFSPTAIRALADQCEAKAADFLRKSVGSAR